MYHRKLGMSQSLAENPFQESPVFQCDADAPSSPFPPERDTPFQELTYHPPSLWAQLSLISQDHSTSLPTGKKRILGFWLYLSFIQQPGTPSTQNPTLSLQWHVIARG